MSDQHEEILTMGTFLLDDREFGVDILKQREVLRMLPVTKVPCSTNFIEGVINLRGAIIPIVNLRARFNMPRKEFTKSTRIINIEVTSDLVVGFVVDSVGQVRRLATGLIEPPPPVIASVEAEYITGVGKIDGNLLIILDVSKILSEEDVERLGQLA